MAFHWLNKNMSSIGVELRRYLGYCLKIMGAAVGLDIYVASCLRKKIRTRSILIGSLSYLDDAVCAMCSKLFLWHQNFSALFPC